MNNKVLKTNKNTENDDSLTKKNYELNDIKYKNEQKNINEIDLTIEDLLMLGCCTDSINDTIITDIKNIEFVDHINLNSMKLKKIPKVLHKFKNLKELDLSNNDLKVIEKLDKNINLEKINFKNNLIEKIEGLDTLINLVDLNLGENMIFEIENLEKNINLELLFLGFNKITEIKGIEFLIKLKTLNLLKNKLTSINNMDYIFDFENINIFKIHLEGNNFEYCVYYKPDIFIFNTVYEFNIDKSGELNHNYFVLEKKKKISEFYEKQQNNEINIMF
jgi:hypothetical protein